MGAKWWTVVAGLAVAGCADAEPVSPEVQQQLFSAVGGLEVGETLTLHGKSAESIVLKGGKEGARYVLIPFLAAEEGAVRLRVRVRGEGLVRVDAPAQAGAAQARLPGGLANDPIEHARLRAWENERLADYLGARGRGVRQSLGIVDGAAPRQAVEPVVGGLVPLRVVNQDPQSWDYCANPLLRTGRIRAVTDHAVLVEDTLNPLPMAAADVESIAREYEELILPLSVENFGEPTDIDGNGRVQIFVTSALNEGARRMGGGVAVGFTFMPDLLPRAPSEHTVGCEASNEGEIFYIIAPDPAATLGVEVPEDFVSRFTSTIIAHELQHMINAGRRLHVIEDARQFEALWLNEGLSHVAEELLFYRATGLQPGSNLSWSTISGDPVLQQAYVRFVRDNLGIYHTYLSSPDGESVMGKNPLDDGFATRGAAWSFLRYLSDQTPGGDAELFRTLVNSPIGGMPNLERALGKSPLGLMQWWTVANFADDRPETDGMDPRFSQPSWDYRSIYAGEVGSVPLTPRLLQPDSAAILALNGGGSSYLLLRVQPGKQAKITTTPLGAVIFAQYRASILRIE